MTQADMKKSAYDLLYLAACAVNGIVPEAENIDLDKLYAAAKFHSLTVISAMALESAGVSLSEKWRQAKAKAIRKNILLDAERAQILEYFEQNDIWYMPLKGVIMQNLYPKMGMRQMADNDILFDSRFQMQLMKYMKSRGYSAEAVRSGNHDVYHKPPVYYFEMHTKLYSEQTDKTIHDYYADVKTRLVKDGGNKYGYHFTDDDFYVFMKVHEYKHYSGGGTGLRSLLDCFVYLRANGDKVDLNYIGGELDKLGIGEFERNSRALAMKVFSSVELPTLTDNERKMLEYYMLSGTYGTQKQIIENRMDKLAAETGSKSKLRYILNRLFPNSEFFKDYAPFFYKHKILLPIGWIYRLFRGVAVNGKTILCELKIVWNKE